MTRTLMSLQTTLLVALCGSRLVAAAQPITPSSLSPCPFTTDEIATALGVEVEDGQAADMQFPGGRDAGCLYPVKGSETAVTVRQTWDPSGSAPSTKLTGDGWIRVKGDLDHAAMKSGGPPADPGVELVYSRGRVRTRIFVHGPNLDALSMQPRLLRLRRVP